MKLQTARRGGRVSAGVIRRGVPRSVQSIANAQAGETDTEPEAVANGNTTDVEDQQNEREQSSHLETTQNEQEEQLRMEFTEKIRLMISGTCQIIQVGALYMNTDNESFQKYSKQLTRVLQKKGHELDRYGVMNFKAEFFKIPGNKNEFVLFQVLEQRKNYEATRREAFMGLFCGYGAGRKKGALNLPTFIYNGPTKMWKIMQPVFQDMFSCDFAIIEFTTMAIRHLTAVWIIQAVKAHLVEKHDRIQITYTNPLTFENAALSTWISVMRVQPFVSRWERMIDDQRIEIRTAVRQIWADISTLLEAEKFHLRRSLILKVAGHSFVLTSMGRFKLNLNDPESILSILKEVTRALERTK